MTHAHVLRCLSEYLEGELSAREESALEAHLAECAGCAAELRALRRSIEWLRALPSPEPPHEIGPAVLARVRAGEAASLRARAWTVIFGSGGHGPALGWLVPLAAAVGIGAVAWLGSPEVIPKGTLEEAGPIRLAEPAARTAEALGGWRVIPAGVPTPSMQACVERSRRGERADECASWYAWFVAMALEDARGFAQEVAGLPPAAREPWLERVSEFATRSGSAPLIGDQLRSSREPGAVRIAKRFERGSGGLRSALVRPVGWQER